MYKLADVVAEMPLDVEVAVTGMEMDAVVVVTDMKGIIITARRLVSLFILFSAFGWRDRDWDFFTYIVRASILDGLETRGVLDTSGR